MFPREEGGGFVKCIYSLCSSLFLVMRGAGEEGTGMPHYDGRVPRLRRGALEGDIILVMPARPTTLP